MTQTNHEKQAAVIAWALNQAGSPYVYGGTGAACTPAYRRERMAQYPAQADNIRKQCPVLSGRQTGCAGCGYRGKPCFDCAQFTRRALEQAGIPLPSGASSQWKAGLWEHQGRMGPEAHGMLCLLFRESGEKERPMAHVGLSLGDGRAMDARSHAQGVVLAPVGAYPWTHYAALPPFPREEALKPGDRGPRVRELQTLLMARGFALAGFGADGIFGLVTLSALHLAQEACGLPRGDAADDRLIAALAAPPQTEIVTEEADEARPGPEERLARLEEWMANMEKKLKEICG